MPNECWNNFTITSIGNPEELNTLIDNEFKHKVNDKYEYNANVSTVKKGKCGVYITITSDWQPNFEWLEGLPTKYTSCWIKNEWYEEGGLAGVWIGFMEGDQKNVSYLDWIDLSIEAKQYLFEDETHNVFGLL
jgi:hypothetical protein